MTYDRDGMYHCRKCLKWVDAPQYRRDGCPDCDLVKIKPYYETELGALYHGDCLEILPQLTEKVDLVLTDPPYGIDVNTDYIRFKSNGIQGRKYKLVEGDKKVIDFKFLFDMNCKKVIFGANNFPQQLPFNSKKDGWICWDKRTNERADKLFGSPFEMAAIIGQRTHKIIRMQHCGVKNADGDHSGRFHPTQKPIKLFYYILVNFFKRETLILDPFLGSGTTAVACERLGRRWIGIEISKEYCDIAVKRIKRENQGFGIKGDFSLRKEEKVEKTGFDLK